MSENTTHILYTQQELVFMFQQHLQDQLNARYPFDPDFKDADFQLETSTDWYNSQKGWDEYDVTPELRTKITLTELINGQPTGNKLKFILDHNEDYSKLAEANKITYEFDHDEDYPEEDSYVYHIDGDSKNYYTPSPFDMEVSFNDGYPWGLIDPFYTDACYANLAPETSQVFSPNYAQNYIKPYYIDYPKQLQKNMPDFKLSAIADSICLNWEDPQYDSDSHIIYRMYPKNRNLEYYESPTFLNLKKHHNHSNLIYFENNVLPNPNEHQKFNCNLRHDAGLQALNDTIVDITNRVTHAQKEIHYQVTQNLYMEDYPKNKMSECNMTVSLPNTLQGTNTVQITVTSEDTSKDFFVTRINDDQYRITEPFDPNNLPDSIDVYSVVTRTKDKGYSKTLGNELKRIVVNDRQPRNSIRVAKQKPKTKFQQTNLQDEPDNGPSLD